MVNGTDERKKYGELIGRVGNEYYFLDEIFKQSGGFQGATATVLRPVPKDEYEERCKPESIEEENREVWQQAVSNGDTDSGLTEWLSYMYISEPYYDESGSEYHDALREIGLSEEAYPIIECTGGGRSFDRNGARGQQFDEVYNPELLAEIAKVEK